MHWSRSSWLRGWVIRLSPLVTVSLFALSGGIFASRAAESSAVLTPPRYALRTNLTQRKEVFVRSGFGSRAEAGIVKALGFLKAAQSPKGSWADQREERGPTALALLAFLGHGETPASREYGATVKAAAQWLMSLQKPSGAFSADDPATGMGEWDHAMCMLALTEYTAMTRDPAAAESVRRAAAWLVKMQHPKGGWSPTARVKDDGVPATEIPDLCRTGWCVQALEAAREASLALPEAAGALDKARAFVRSLALPDGSFACTAVLRDPWRSPIGSYVMATAPRTASADRKLAEAGMRTWLGTADKVGFVESLMTIPIERPVVLKLVMLPPNVFPAKMPETLFVSPGKRKCLDLGALYYCGLASRMLGSTFWERARPMLVNNLLRNQSADGSWPESGSDWDPRVEIVDYELKTLTALSGTEKCSIARTALCVLILETPFRAGTP